MRCVAIRDYVGNYIAFIPIGPAGAPLGAFNARSRKVLEVIMQTTADAGQRDIFEVDVIATLTEPGSVTFEKELTGGEQGFPKDK